MGAFQEMVEREFEKAHAVVEAMPCSCDWCGAGTTYGGLAEHMRSPECRGYGKDRVLQGLSAVVGAEHLTTLS